MDELKAKLAVLINDVVDEATAGDVDPTPYVRRIITTTLNEGWRPPCQADAVTHLLEDLRDA